MTKEREAVFRNAMMAAAMAAGMILPVSAETVAVSKQFGFDPADSTRFLQSAIDSGASTVVVDRAEGPWITLPLRGRSNQTLIFERGVELQAKKGAFMGLNDCLFTLKHATNVVISGKGALWRMHRSDYHAAPYKKGEWRHSLCILGCDNITVEGLTLLESGGDGVYVGTGAGYMKIGTPSTRVTLRDLVCDRHYRQGVSIISARHLLIERCVMRNTWGTPPAAGIDFEPNMLGEELHDCVMRDCTLVDNQGNGIEFYVGQIDGSSAPLTARFERCRTKGNKHGFQLLMNNGKIPLAGEIVCEDCAFVSSRASAVKVGHRPAKELPLAFNRCKFLDCGTEEKDVAGSVDFDLVPCQWQDPILEGMAFTDCVLRQPYPHDIMARKFQFVTRKASDVTGSFALTTPFGSSLLRLDDAWRKSYFPKLDYRPVPPFVKFDPLEAKPHDEKPGEMVRLSQISVRNHARYRFYASAAGEVRMSGRLNIYGHRGKPQKPMVVRDAKGDEVGRVSLPGTSESAFAVKVPAAGFYTIEADLSGSAMVLCSADAPVAIDAGRHLNLIAATGTMYVNAKDGKRFSLAFTGDGGESVHPIVRDPSGKLVWERDNISGDGWESFVSEDRPAAGVWSLELAKPTKAPFEDESVIVLGVAPNLFLCRERIW